MKVHFVGAGPGDPDLLTIKAHRLLTSCRICVYAGSLVSPAVLALLPEDAVKHDSAALNLDDMRAIFEDAHQKNVDVVRLHSGDPSIYGAIGEQIRELNTLGIPYDVTPGVSSFQAAAAAVGVELTSPEVSQTIILTRAAGRTPLPPEQEINELARTKATLCLFLSTQKLSDLTKDLAAHYGWDCPVAVVYRASWPDQVVLKGNLSAIAAQVADAGVQKTALILVGHALAAPVASSKLYDAAFTHEYRTGV